MKAGRGPGRWAARPGPGRGRAVGYHRSVVDRISASLLAVSASIGYTTFGNMRKGEPMKTKATTATKAVGYVRVSTEGQATEGVSLEAQKGRIEAWCSANGYTLAAMHVDAGLSGKRADNRPGLQAALADVCKSGGVLVVYSLSRLARSVPDAFRISERLAKRGADLVSLSESIDTTSAMGRAFYGFMAVMNAL